MLSRRVSGASVIGIAIAIAALPCAGCYDFEVAPLDDAAPLVDGGAAAASRADAPGVDAWSPIDAPGVDAWSSIDAAGVDASRADASTASDATSDTDASSSLDAARGCRTNRDCGSLEYCQKAGCLSRPTGSCVARDDCHMETPPVCGCDGVRYEDACAAQAAGQNVDPGGLC